MRNPDRIPEVLGALRRAWLANPDQRLGQLLINAARFYSPRRERFHGHDALWHIEEEEFLAALNAMAAQHQPVVGADVPE